MRVKDLIVENVKVAAYKITGGTDTWHEEILKKFYEQNNYIPKEYFVEVKLTQIDENRGYGVGSIIVWKGDKQINFPIIINNNSLSNFDVFTTKENCENVFHFANKDNVLKALSDNNLGTPENINKIIGSPVKLVGGSPQRTVARVEDPSGGQTSFPSIEKMSSLICKRDLEKIATNLIVDPDMSQNFYENTGDMIQKIIKLNGYIKIVPKKDKIGIIDVNGFRDINKQIVMIEDEFLDVSKMVPIQDNTVCELRCKTYGSMEEILSYGSLSNEKLKTGYQVNGVMLRTIGYSFISNNSIALEGDGDIKSIFISTDLKCVSKTEINYEKGKSNKVFFYGFPLNINIDFIINEIKSRAIRKMVATHAAMSKKYFESDYGGNRTEASRIINSIGTKRDESSYYSGSDNYFVTKLNDQYVVLSICSPDFFITTMFNGNQIFKIDKSAFIVSSVQNIVKISHVEDVVLQKAVGESEYLYLVPQSSFFISGRDIVKLPQENFISPMNKVTDDLLNVPKIAMKVNDKGFWLSGDSVDELKKIGVIPECCEKDMAFNILREHGAKDDQIITLTKKAAANYFNEVDEPVYFLNTKKSILSHEKCAALKNEQSLELNAKHLLNKALTSLKEYAAPNGTLKMASLLNDQSAADVVLSVDYINHENVEMYIACLDKIKEIINSLASMLIASRMGLKILDEDNIIKSIKCLDIIVSGLENLKTSVKL